LTPKGAQALDDGNRIKRDIETRYRSVIGDARFDALTVALDELFEAGLE
jgi:hypothetical protein